jgi:hypothetical protein
MLHLLHHQIWIVVGHGKSCGYGLSRCGKGCLRIAGPRRGAALLEPLFDGHDVSARKPPKARNGQARAMQFALHTLAEEEGAYSVAPPSLAGRDPGWPAAQKSEAPLCRTAPGFFVNSHS